MSVDPGKALKALPGSTAAALESPAVFLRRGRLPDALAGNMTRAYPEQPVVAVIAVVYKDSHVLLVRRANPPDIGRWGFPGGKIDAGETVHAAATRELLEETGIHAAAVRVFTAVDVIDHDENGRLRHHYVLLAVLCAFVSGEPTAGDDALEARWFPVTTLDNGALALSLDVASIARQGATLAI